MTYSMVRSIEWNWLCLRHAVVLPYGRANEPNSLTIWSDTHSIKDCLCSGSLFHLFGGLSVESTFGVSVV